MSVVTVCQVDTPESSDKNWLDYKAGFIDELGRIIDTGNANISHSEGQGYGLLLSVRNNDKQTFDKILHWTQQYMQVRDDNLFIWRRRINED